jgi:MFS superfamily sulfate permease-like transporter
MSQTFSVSGLNCQSCVNHVTGALSALAGVLTSGLLRGVMIGAIISLVLLIGRASRPHVATLGRIPGTRRFSDQERHPDNELVPGLRIFRPEAIETMPTLPERVRLLTSRIGSLPHPAISRIDEFSEEKQTHKNK